jgi:hypothetical protein
MMTSPEISRSPLSRYDDFFAQGRLRGWGAFKCHDETIKFFCHLKIPPIPIVHVRTGAQTKLVAVFAFLRSYVATLASAWLGIKSATSLPQVAAYVIASAVGVRPEDDLGWCFEFPNGLLGRQADPMVNPRKPYRIKLPQGTTGRKGR